MKDWQEDPATEKQQGYVRRIMDKISKEKVYGYMKVFYPYFNMSTLTKGQAQKIINRFGHVTNKPIYRVAGRDVPWNVR